MRTVIAPTLCALMLALSACGGSEQATDDGMPQTTPEALDQEDKAREAAAARTEQSKKDGSWLGEIKVEERDGKQVLIVEKSGDAPKLCERLKKMGTKQFAGSDTATITAAKGKTYSCKLSS